MFLRNEWYVAALSHELRDRPVQRTILGDPLAIFRTASGRAVILDDRCPHRGASLSSGAISGEIPLRSGARQSARSYARAIRP